MKNLLICFILLLADCGNIIKDAGNGIADPTERGLMYVATAIIIAAIARACFNK